MREAVISNASTIKESHQLLSVLEARRETWHGFPLRDSVRNLPCDTVTLNFWLLELQENKILSHLICGSLILSHLLCGNLLQ